MTNSVKNILEFQNKNTLIQLDSHYGSYSVWENGTKNIVSTDYLLMALYKYLITRLYNRI